MNTTAVRGLLLACALLTSFIVGAVCGVLTLLADARPAVAVMAGGAGFVASVQLLIRVIVFVATAISIGPGSSSDGVGLRTSGRRGGSRG